MPLNNEVASLTGNINYSDRLFSFVGIDLMFEKLVICEKTFIIKIWLILL